MHQLCIDYILVVYWLCISCASVIIVEIVSGNLGIKEKREYFVAYFWEHLKIAKRVPAKVTFNINIISTRDAQE